MPYTLVDSNVILDVLTQDRTWMEWSTSAMSRQADRGVLAINPIIYAEVSVRFTRIEDLEAALPHEHFRRMPLPWEAGFLAGKCFMQYRKRRGKKVSTLPDFYIGAHATVGGMTLLTRDANRYRTYFPRLRVIAPDA
ncbi:MAG: type II toxin-antitoxin system VapC family toxin [Deltaproteobacteria bacterium]|nr:type II toxin-antitoxin system VapC family toxin [Deltaproteobacteria bacterium]